PNGVPIVQADPYKLTSATDPFGRTATFNYIVQNVGYTNVNIGTTNPIMQTAINAWVLGGIKDEIGMTSQFIYGMQVTNSATPAELLYNDVITALITPYGTTTFSQGSSNTTRWVETGYPDGSRDRVEYNQNVSIPASDPPSTVPLGMSTYNLYLDARDTFFWSRNAGATAYGDYTKARIFHWLHTDDLTTTSGILESSKDPLENRVWRDYAGQGGSYEVGANNHPTHLGRVLDDGSTQLYTYAYNGFGRLTNAVDPVGRTFSYVYDTNGIDLLEIRQTRGHNNELLFKATYNSQHCPLTEINASGQTNTFTYNARGQMLTVTDPNGAITTYNYDGNGYLLSVDGPLPGTGDSFSYTYDSFGRVRTQTDMSGYTMTYDYDNLDRITRITYPDTTFEQTAYDRLDPVMVQDRAGRQTLYQYDNMRQLVKKTDPLNRVTLFDWCNCGAVKSMTDPLGRTTVWDRDVEGRLTDKTYADGSKVAYTYENTTSRIRAVTDENLQDTILTYNLDNTVASCSYDNAIIPTPTVTYTYDPNYERMTSRTDGAGTTSYSYYPITNNPALGAGELASVAGPVTNALITYSYDALGRRVHRFLNGVDSARIFDAAGREVGASNALGNFSYAYDGNSDRVTSKSFPNGLTAGFSYGNNLQDFRLQGIANANGAAPVSEFAYTYNVPADQITTWSQQVGAQAPSIFAFGYDAVNQLLTVTVTNGGVLVNGYGYSYDYAGNRGSEQIGSSFYASSYNALNQLNLSTAPGSSRTNEWDAAHRLVAVNSGNQRTEFSYDGTSQLTGIRQLVNGVEVSHRLFVWDGGRICEELDTNGLVAKRFFPQGVQLADGPNAGNYYYTRDHLGSIRELTDTSGNVRAEYSYDPFGNRTKVSGDLDADYGFAGMFWSSEANLSITHFRAYDPNLGRWLSRDPLKNAELTQGPNLYEYTGNEPVAMTDPAGLVPFPRPGFDTVGMTLLAAAASGQAGELAEDLGFEVPAGQQLLQDAQQCVQTLVGYSSGWGPVVAHAHVALADTVVADTLVADAGLADTMVADTMIPNVVPDAAQTLDSIVPEVEDLAEDADPSDLEWANAWMNAMLNYRGPFMGDYYNQTGLSRIDEYSAIYDRYVQIKQILGVPGLD
ncbi:MAG TPA: RHS repeat-associated core domain-containing protein, partial [Alphaproteobacteria bacterium]|nr:RHS repeat-associated core domain-containing protein [Alphaproteobacteria bacterium]